MKKSFRTLIMMAAAGVVASLAFVGCSTSNADRDSTHKRTAGQYIDDKVLVQKVNHALGSSDIYKFPDVKVNTYKGTVQLSGFVESQEQKIKAEEIARNVNGVMNIENNITLKGETERVRGATGTYERNGTNVTTGVYERNGTIITTNRTTVTP